MASRANRSVDSISPPVDLVPTEPTDEKDYFAALHAGDQLDWRPLMRIWEQRFERFTDPAHELSLHPN